MITENLSTLKINKLTQEQYDRELAAGNIDGRALYLTPDEETDLSEYAKISDMPTKVSELDNDAGYLTQHQDLSNYALKSELPTDYLKEIPEEYITESELNDKGYITEHQSLEGYATTEYVNNKIGDIESALDNIIAVQELYIGGGTS